MATLFENICVAHDWAEGRIKLLSQEDINSAKAIQSEFEEWLDPEIKNHDVVWLKYKGKSK